MFCGPWTGHNTNRKEDQNQRTKAADVKILKFNWGGIRTLPDPGKTEEAAESKRKLEIMKYENKKYEKFKENTTTLSLTNKTL